MIVHSTITGTVAPENIYCITENMYCYVTLIQTVDAAAGGSSKGDKNPVNRMGGEE